MRSDRLAENEYLRRITQARDNLRELRVNPQRVGSRSVRIYRVFSQDDYDIEVTDVGFDNRVVEVVFTPDDEGLGLGGVFRLEYTVTYSGVGNPVNVTREDLPPSQSGPSVFRFYLSSSDSFPNAWARLKFYVFANGSGTITATLL